MASTKGRIIRLISGLALDRATLVSVEKIGGFRRMRMKCRDAAFTAGSKVQMLLPSNDMRTYTPIRAPEGMVLLGWVHTDGPGARWMSEAAEGDEYPFVGPQRSLDPAPGPVIIIGDETSVALAGALQLERPGQVRALIQSQSPDIRLAGASIGLTSVDLIAPGGTTALVDRAQAALAEWPEASVTITGGSELVISAREALRAARIGNIKTKAYWVPGKTGLD